QGLTGTRRGFRERILGGLRHEGLFSTRPELRWWRQWRSGRGGGDRSDRGLLLGLRLFFFRLLFGERGFLCGAAGTPRVEVRDNLFEFGANISREDDEQRAAINEAEEQT